MSTLNDRLASVRNTLLKERCSSTIDKSLDWLTYIIGLLPDELVIGKVAQIANKLISDRNLNSRFKALQDQVLLTNEQLTKLQEGTELVEAIGATVATNTALQKTLEAVLNELKKTAEISDSEFVLDTSNWSTQEIIRTAINAKWVGISATNASSNIISNSHIRSDRTHLVADGGSRNVVRDSTFSNANGQVGMVGKHIQSGQVSVAGASIGYHGNNSATEMGGWRMGTDANGNFTISTVSRPSLTARCPRCYREFNLTHSDLAGKTHFKCPHCSNLAQIPPLP